MQYSGAGTSLDELVRQVYVPAREGSLQPELLAAARGAERIPYVIAPSLPALVAEVMAGRPVLVLQNLGISWAPRWHYAVVYAVDPVSHEIHLRSGTVRDYSVDVSTFLRTWQRGDFWGLVTLRPGELPAEPVPDRYYSAVAGMEDTGHLRAARLGWLAAVKHWPGDELPLFGLANTELAIGNPASAEAHYRQLLAGNPQRADASNNLAYALARQGKAEEARDILENTLKMPSLSAAMRAELEHSLQEIREIQE